MSFTISNFKFLKLDFFAKLLLSLIKLFNLNYFDNIVSTYESFNKKLTRLYNTKVLTLVFKTSSE